MVLSIITFLSFTFLIVGSANASSYHLVRRRLYPSWSFYNFVSTLAHTIVEYIIMSTKVQYCKAALVSFDQKNKHCRGQRQYF